MTTTTISHAKASASLLDLAAVMDKYTRKTSSSGDTTTASPFVNGTQWRNQGHGDNNTNDSDDDPTEQEQFNRISGILTQLIQEANNAIYNKPSTTRNSTETEETDDKVTFNKALESMNRSVVAISTLVPETSDPIQLPQQTSSNDTSKESRRRSRLPRPTKLPSETDVSYSYQPSPSSASYTSTTPSNDAEDDDEEDLFSGISSTLTTPMSRTISPLLFEKQETVTEPREDPLMASFERLDSSLAMVDFLSRDLANYRRQHPRSKGTMQPLGQSVAPPSSLNNNNNIYATKHHDVWTRLLMLPLLYIPWSLLLPLWEDMMADQAPIQRNPVQLVSPTAGLAVFIILMAILHLLRTSNHQCTSRQFITNKDRSNV